MTSGKVVPAEASPETASRFDELVDAIAHLRDPEVVAAFLRDLCTSTELDAMGQRLQVARLVDEGVSVPRDLASHRGLDGHGDARRPVAAPR